ncbi:endonuclease domain-containing protein [Candidatus Peregrinibacteria bacterium]|nr:endonuclease domain-containing protein [Candidatus Peregrinibacteria bacterium]
MYEDKLIQGSRNKARYLRKNQTSAESLLWKKLRARRFLNLKFRRQVPLGPYVLDFLCFEKKIAIEIDGSVHMYKHKTDAIKTIHLERKDLAVLRFTNAQVKGNMSYVLSEIARAAGSPLPPGEG